MQMNWSRLLQKRLKKQIICDSFIYEIDLSDIKEDEHNFLWAFLNEEEKNGASRMIRHVGERFVVCRSICKKILSEHLSVDIENINFDYEKNGKPYLKNEQNLHFNISHSRDIAILGIRYGSSIGVDVEFIDEKCDIFPLMDLFMHEHEKKWALETDTLNRFFIIWTLKEAVMKKTGTGISEDGFPVITIEDNNIYKCDAGTLHCNFISGADYVMSICI
jgi:4'-phosphopantetheinyl transferase